MVVFTSSKVKHKSIGTATNTEYAIASGIDTAVDTVCGDKPKTKFKVTVAGATGYVGQELIRLLLLHPRVELVALASKTHSGESFEDILPGFEGQFPELAARICCDVNVDELAETSDVVFLALPHGISGDVVTAKTIENAKVIDLSGDFRLKESQTSVPAVYGLSELNRESIAGAKFIANPGCYATAAILALAPLVKERLIASNSIIIDGKSGVSGAGRTASLKTHFNECNESMKAYQLPTHRHTPEIEETLSQYTDSDVITTFAAHLVPMNRGILLTAYATLNGATSNEEVQAIYNQHYGEEPFIRLRPAGTPLPETRWVKGSNYCDIGYAVDERSNRIVVVSAIDNLIKGAAGQAVQNMNIMLGIDESTGLKQIPIFL